MCGLASCRFNRYEAALSDGLSDDIDATVCGIGNRLGRLLRMEFDVPEICPLLVRSLGGIARRGRRTQSGGA